MQVVQEESHQSDQHINQRGVKEEVSVVLLSPLLALLKQIGLFLSSGLVALFDTLDDEDEVVAAGEELKGVRAEQGNHETDIDHIEKNLIGLAVEKRL